MQFLHQICLPLRNPNAAVRNFTQLSASLPGQPQYRHILCFCRPGCQTGIFRIARGADAKKHIPRLTVAPHLLGIGTASAISADQQLATIPNTGSAVGLPPGYPPHSNQIHAPGSVTAQYSLSSLQTSCVTHSASISPSDSPSAAGRIRQTSRFRNRHSCSSTRSIAGRRYSSAREKILPKTIRSGFKISTKMDSPRPSYSPQAS